ncbi:MAG: hypothetical protein ACRECD_14240 [Burkholderiaceae bacterium]
MPLSGASMARQISLTDDEYRLVFSRPAGHAEQPTDHRSGLAPAVDFAFCGIKAQSGVANTVSTAV